MCPECGKKFTRADSLVRHSRLHEIDGDTAIDPTERLTGGSGTGYRGSARLSGGPREDSELGRKGSLQLSEALPSWSGSSPGVRLPQEAGLSYEPAAKRRRPNGDSPPSGAMRHGSEAAYMETRTPDTGWDALTMRDPSHMLEMDPTSMLQAAACLGALSQPSNQGVFGTPSSAMGFGNNPDPHFEGLLIDHIRNPQDTHATSYRTPQSEGGSNHAPTSTIDHPAYMYHQPAHLGESTEHAEGPTLGHHVETPGAGVHTYTDPGTLEPLGGGPSLDEPGNGFDVGSGYGIETNPYVLPMGFGIEENSDLDLLQFLASDTSIAFAHT